MNIAFDGSPLALATGGLRRYTEELILAVAREYPEDSLKVVSDQRISWKVPGSVQVECRKPRTWAERRWWLVGVQIAARGSDVFHGCDFSVPYLPSRPSVMTLHDLSPWRNPVWHSKASRVRARTPLLLRLGIATMVITPSEQIRREAIDYFRLAPSRVAAVPEAASDFFRPAPPVRSELYFLFVGTIEPRKRVDVLIEAWREVAREHPVKLLIAGRLRAGEPAIAPMPNLELLGEVPDSDLPPLYSGAVATVYPSEYEGWGLPALEAMQCGCPVIAGSAASVHEFGGGAVLRAEDARTLAHVMTSLLTNATLRIESREAGLTCASRFSWARTARETHAVYEEARGRFYG